MTAINLCFRGSQVFIACDTAVSISGKGFVGHKSKCFTIPHARAAIACSGPVTASAFWMFEALSAYDIIDVDDLVRIAPDLLREGWEHTAKLVPHVAFLAGITRDDQAKAYMLGSPEDFRPIHLSPGIYTFPLLADIKAAVTAEKSEGTPAVPKEPVRQERIPWHAMVQACVSFLDEQAWQHPDSVGGHADCTLIQPESIYQHRMRAIRPVPVASVSLDVPSVSLAV